MDADQTVCQQFFCFEEMADVSPCIIATRIALTAFFNRSEIAGKASIAHGKPSCMGHGHAIAGYPRRKYAVEHVDATGDAFDEAIGCTDSHKVPCLMLRQVRCRML